MRRSGIIILWKFVNKRLKEVGLKKIGNNRNIFNRSNKVVCRLVNLFLKKKRLVINSIKNYNQF